MTSLPQLALDHVVYAAPNLEAAIESLADRLGVRASPGGRHLGLGTRNALLALQDERYIEVIGPDPAQPDPPGARPFGIDGLETPRLVTWAVRESQLDERIVSARKAGFDPGNAIAVSRKTPAGETISWRLSFSPALRGDGLVPFLIDWGDVPHPSATAASGCSLVSMRAEHPDPPAVRRDLAALGAALEVSRADAPALILQLSTPKGPVELR